MRGTWHMSDRTKIKEYFINSGLHGCINYLPQLLGTGGQFRLLYFITTLQAPQSDASMCNHSCGGLHLTTCVVASDFWPPTSSLRFLALVTLGCKLHIVGRLERPLGWPPATLLFWKKKFKDVPARLKPHKRPSSVWAQLMGVVVATPLGDASCSSPTVSPRRRG
jgi:hypothetical protein